MRYSQKPGQKIGCKALKVVQILRISLELRQSSLGDSRYRIRRQSIQNKIHKYSIADRASIPKILKCPADNIQITIGWAVFGQRRTYAMNWAGPSFQISTRDGALPPPNYGVGVYYNLRGSAKGSLPDWEARGYKDTVVGDPAGTILLVEQAEGGNIAGNDWPSFCMGPTGPSSGDQSPYQIATGGRRNWGANAYGLHSRRFNYLFHDGHASIHKITDTVGSGTTNSPRGMWTMTPGD